MEDRDYMDDQDYDSRQAYWEDQGWRWCAECGVGMPSEAEPYEDEDGVAYCEECRAGE